MKQSQNRFIAFFSTGTLLRIVVALGVVVVMKALAAYYDFDWMSVLTNSQ
jgi:hypothetical protein